MRADVVSIGVCVRRWIPARRKVQSEARLYLDGKNATQLSIDIECKRFSEAPGEILKLKKKQGSVTQVHSSLIIQSDYSLWIQRVL